MEIYKNQCEIDDINPVQDLKYGMDFRLPKYRREVFLRFYEFHLKYNLHPGMVYNVIPEIFERENYTMEQKLWFMFINGNSQNAISTYVIFQHFPDFKNLDIDKLDKWYNTHFRKLNWDTDRRHHKTQFIPAVKSYIENLGGQTQEEFFFGLAFNPYNSEYIAFDNLWDTVKNEFHSFGRLSTFSYLEYLRIAGVPIDCGNLFLEDISGSKSHRNGICKVLGRDDLDWRKGNKVYYSKATVSWLTTEGERLLEDARSRINHKDVSYFTLESTLCCYKSWHRPNRRYPNVYNDMFFNRIKHGQNKWRKSFKIFWDIRKETLPHYLRLEVNPNDLGLKPEKQNHYLKTGQVIMMNHEYECFQNDYNDNH